MIKEGVYRCLTADYGLYYVFIIGTEPFLQVVTVLSTSGTQAKLTIAGGDWFINGSRVTQIKVV